MTFSFWFGSSSDAPSNSDGSVPGLEPRARVTIERGRRCAETDDIDAQLVRRLRSDDETALVSLVRGYTGPLTRFAYEFTSSYDVADDIVDDVFVWIWEHRTTLEIHGTVRSYLYGATRNRALNARRDATYREAWQARHADNPADAAMGTSDRDIISQVEVRELGLLLRRAIDTLAEGRRTAVRLRWIEEMSYAEIAAVMGTSVVGVKRQLNRALHDLREILPGYLK